MCNLLKNIYLTLRGKPLKDEITHDPRPDPNITFVQNELFLCEKCGRQILIPAKDLLDIRCKCNATSS